MTLPPFTQRSPFWTAFFVVWFVTLWFLSGRPLDGPKFETDIPLDKVYHFGYFFGGGGLLSAALFLREKPRLSWSALHLAVLIALFATGSLDEWHQSWFPFRSGNDAGDLTANFFGALTGSLVFRKLQPRIFPQGAATLSS